MIRTKLFRAVKCTQLPSMFTVAEVDVFTLFFFTCVSIPLAEKLVTSTRFNRQ